MKTIKILLAIAILSTFTSNAQGVNNKTETTQDSFNNVLRVNVFYAIAGGINLDYEKVLNKKSSFDIEAIHLRSSLIDAKHFRDNNLKANYTSLNIGYKYYLSRKENRPQGWYLRGGIITDFGKVKQTIAPKDKVNIFAMGGQFKTGYQLVLSKFLKGLTLDTGIFVDYRQLVIKDIPSSDLRAFTGGIDISIGYSF